MLIYHDEPEPFDSDDTRGGFDQGDVHANTLPIDFPSQNIYFGAEIISQTVGTLGRAF